MFPFLVFVFIGKGLTSEMFSNLKSKQDAKPAMTSSKGRTARQMQCYSNVNNKEKPPATYCF
jgi:hypothetical protein